LDIWRKQPLWLGLRNHDLDHCPRHPLACLRYDRHDDNPSLVGLRDRRSDEFVYQHRDKQYDHGDKQYDHGRAGPQAETEGKMRNPKREASVDKAPRNGSMSVCVGARGEVYWTSEEGTIVISAPKEDNRRQKRLMRKINRMERMGREKATRSPSNGGLGR